MDELDAEEEVLNDSKTPITTALIATSRISLQDVISSSSYSPDSGTTISFV